MSRTSKAKERVKGSALDAALSAPAAPVAFDRDAFEAWIASDSTLSTEADGHGYRDMTVALMWHAWQAAKKTSAPIGALVGESDAEARLGLAGCDSTCQHDFTVQPSSGIRICTACGLSETAARAALNRISSAPAAPVAQDAERDEARRTVQMAHELGTAIAAERDQLRAEVEALREANNTFATAAILPDDKVIVDKAEVEALRADAERYRWLRSDSQTVTGPCAYGSWMGLPMFNDELDSAIDAARKQQ